MTTEGTQLREPATLPDDLAACHAMIQQLLEQLGNTNRKLTKMEHQLQQLLRRLYGRSSEKIDPRQMALFAEMLQQVEVENPPAEPEPEPAAPPKPRKGHGRRRIPDDLPRERVIHDLPEEEKPCPCCGAGREVIGQEVSEQLDYEPARLKVIQHVRLKYICKDCEQRAAEGGPQIATAEKPLSPIEKGLAAPGLIAYVMVSKYCDHLPLHRLERICKRHGMEVPRSTQWGWIFQAGRMLALLTERMAEKVRASKVIHTDDTPVDVLDRKRNKTRQGRFWVYVGDDAHPYTVFDYTPSRSRAGPMAFLKDWGKDERKYLQADAFGGYDGIYAGHAGGQVTEVACWAHCRRYFYDARRSDHARSARAMAQIRLLYEVEKEAREQFRAQGDNPSLPLSAIRLTLRQEQAVKHLDDFKEWLEGEQVTHGGQVLPKSPMGEAITYALNQWKALKVYTTDGHLNIDNNVSERALRRIAVGRNNWQFLGSDNGGTTAAIMFSLIATCERHQVNPFEYLRDVLTRLASHPHKRLDELLPDRWQPLA